jgi:hypothetical protein
VRRTLFYLQFGLQPLVHHVPQAALSLVGATAIAWGTVRRLRGKAASLVALIGTLPVLALHAVMSLEDPGELPFLLGSIPAPVVAAVPMFRVRGCSTAGERQAEDPVVLCQLLRRTHRFHIDLAGVSAACAPPIGIIRESA